jgi:dihydrofolate reductase
MRKLIYAINITLDGCCDHTKGVGSEEVHEYHKQLLLDADQLVYGRKTYELMVPFWPDIAKKHAAETKHINDFAQAFDAVDNILVFSRSLAKVEGAKTRIVDTDLHGEILKLKQQKGKNILTGGVDIPSQLIQLGLVDEYRVVIQPAIAGAGRRLLPDLDLPESLQLTLAESTVFKSGFVALRYVKR